MDVNEKRTKHKCCWFCGNRLRGGHGVKVDMNGHTVDAHKSCKEASERQDALDNAPFGMEY